MTPRAQASPGAQVKMQLPRPQPFLLNQSSGEWGRGICIFETLRRDRERGGGMKAAFRHFVPLSTF